MTRLRAALDRTASALLLRQRSDGLWSGACDAGLSSTAIVAVVEQFINRLDPADASGYAAYLRRQQLEDGSFPSHPLYKRGIKTDTALALAALRAIGAHDAAARAQRWLFKNGGFEDLELLPKLMLSMAGVIQSSALPIAPSALLLIPNIERPLASLGGFMAVMGLHTLTPILCKLRGKRVQGRERLSDYLRSHQNPDGSWAGLSEMTALCVAALYAAKLENGGFRRGLDRLAEFKEGESVRFVRPFVGDVWNTAVTLKALLQAGVDSPRLQGAIERLLDEQCDTPAPLDWQQTKEGAPRSGGWAFEEGNALAPDVDTTTQALDVLTICGAAPKAAQRAEAWLLGMQNDDGGWGTFSHGRPSKAPGPMFEQPWTRPKSLTSVVPALKRAMAEFGDPSTEGITARVLSTLGARGYRFDHPQVAKAIRFLERQELDGLWWGRWEVNYAAATAFVIRGLIDVGLGQGAPIIQRALSRLCAFQNEDGGFGEQVESYLDPTLAGVGESNAWLTSQVLQALLTAGASQKRIQRCVDWLIGHQTQAAGWAEDQLVIPVMPPYRFYTNQVAFDAMTLQGLVTFNRRTMPSQTRPTQAQGRSTRQ